MRSTDQSNQQIGILLDVFQKEYNGRKNAKSGDEILLKLKGTGRLNICPQTFRELLGIIRENDMLKPGFIVSRVSIGYWLSFDSAEQDEYLQRELSRMSNQFTNVSSLHKRLKYKSKNKPKSQLSIF